MMKLLLSAALVAVLAAPVSASPLIPASTAASAATESDYIFQVKKKGYRAYGWSQGRKVGWRGRGMPPGQYKKIRRF